MSEDFRIVYVTNSDFDARVVAGLLETNGVPALVHQEPAGSAMGITIGLLGEVKVAVRPEDYERALDILDSTPDETLLPDATPDDDTAE